MKIENTILRVKVFTTENSPLRDRLHDIPFIIEKFYLRLLFGKQQKTFSN